MTEYYGQQSTPIPADDILGEGFPHLTQQITLLAGSGALARGTVLGQVTATGEYVAYNAAGTDDGRRAAKLILADDIAVGAADVAAVAFRTGVFRRAKLIGLDAAAEAALDARSIFVR